MGIEGSHHIGYMAHRVYGEKESIMKFIENGKYAVAKDSMGVDITELEKLRSIKENINSADLRQKIDAKIEKAEAEYMGRALSLNIKEENKKEREKKCQEALEVVDAVASTLKKVVVWAYNKH